MKETLRHSEAFEYYYSLGDKRSVQEVGRKFAVSRNTVGKWSKEYQWDDRVQLRDVEIAKRIENKTNTSIVNEKAKLLNIVKKTIADAVPKINSQKLCISTMTDLLRTIDTALKLMGEDPNEKPRKYILVDETDAGNK